MSLQATLTRIERDRRRKPRGKQDRRRSERWNADRIIQWRLESDSQVHTGRILSRSLDGFVVRIDANDMASPVHRLIAVDLSPGARTGFRTAVVQRHEVTREGIVLYAEVES